MHIIMHSNRFFLASETKLKHTQLRNVSFAKACFFSLSYVKMYFVFLTAFELIIRAHLLIKRQTTTKIARSSSFPDIVTVFSHTQCYWQNTVVNTDFL